MPTERWDLLLTDSVWYVPAADLLAIRLTSASPDTPTAASDQTLWSIGEVRDGRFEGSSAARIVASDGSVTQSLSQMQGVVTARGQVRITFTTPLGSTITGIGQVRQVNGEPAMEMQMITAGGGAYTTHWAYMRRVVEGTAPPEPGPPNGSELDERSSEFRWLVGTSWSIAPSGGRKKAPGGSFTITEYRNGYFWGAGSSASGQGDFVVLGSITPEGNVFLNVIDSSFNLRVSQGGQLRGNRTSARVRLRPYDPQIGEANDPLELRLISEPVFPRQASMTAASLRAETLTEALMAPLAAGWAADPLKADPLTAGGLAVRKGRMGKPGKACEPAPIAAGQVTPWLAGVWPLIGPGELDQSPEHWHRTLACLQQPAEPGGAWPI